MIIPDALAPYLMEYAGCRSSGKKKARLTAGLFLFLSLRLSAVSRDSGVEKRFVAAWALLNAGILRFAQNDAFR
jgi:hypothetical protein